MEPFGSLMIALLPVSLLLVTGSAWWIFRRQHGVDMPTRLRLRCPS